MIKINLLPQEMAGGRGGGQGASVGSGAALVTLVLAGIFFANVALGGWLFVIWNKARSEYDTAKAEADKVAKELKETEVQYSATKMSIERMETLVKVADALAPADRLLWSRKLNALPMLTEDGVYLTEMQVLQKVTDKETPESLKRRNEWEKTKKGTPPEIQKVPVFAQTLTLDGLAYVPEGTENQRLDKIITFNKNLKDKKVRLPFDKEESSFLHGFVGIVLVSPVQVTKSDGRDVTKFKFTINTKPVTIDVNKPAPAAEPPKAKGSK
jgi:hypothetical protein